MSKKQHKTIISPVGTLKFLAVAKAVKKYKSEETEFTARLEFDGSDAEALAFRKAVESINDKRIITKGVSKEGNFMINLRSKYQPTVLNKDGEQLTEGNIPHFNSAVDNGTARVEALIYDKSSPAALILGTVQIVSLDKGEDKATQVASGLEALAKSLSN